MELHTALIGQDPSGIDQALSGTDREHVKERAREAKGDNQSAALFSSEVECNPTEFCGHNDWQWIDHQFFDGNVMRCQSCRTWLFISNDETLFFKNLNDQSCSECDGDLFPFNQALNQCIDCNGFMNGDQYLSADEFKSVMSFNLGQAD